MSAMSKRPAQSDSHQMDNSNKRKRPNKVTGSGFTVESITTARRLQGLLGDFSNPDGLNYGEKTQRVDFSMGRWIWGTDPRNIGLQQFKVFLGRCSNSDDVTVEDAEQNLRILKEWLETQSKNANDNGEGEGQGNAFMGILQVWSYASQVSKTIPNGSPTE